MNVKTGVLLAVLALSVTACAGSRAMQGGYVTEVNPTDGRTGGVGPLSNHPGIADRFRHGSRP